MSMITLNLEPIMLKMLPHLVISYHVLSQFVTLYPLSLIEI